MVFFTVDDYSRFFVFLLSLESHEFGRVAFQNFRISRRETLFTTRKHTASIIIFARSEDDLVFFFGSFEGG